MMYQTYDYYGYKNLCGIDALVNQTFSDVVQQKDQILFIQDGSVVFVMAHDQDCCEHVYVEDIAGDLADLVGSPILRAEAPSSEDLGPLDEYEESYTWTFYKLDTIKGGVTIRWYGSSNGYYSESVDIFDLRKKD